MKPTEKPLTKAAKKKIVLESIKDIDKSLGIVREALLEPKTDPIRFKKLMTVADKLLDNRLVLMKERDA